MAKIEEIERRLLNWGRWRHGAGAGGLGYARVVYTEVLATDRDNYQEAVIPTVDCEAEVTERAVQALASELRATVEVYYVLGGGLAAKARRLAVAEATVKSRIDRSHRIIQAWLAERERGQLEQRRRVELLTQAARPKGEF
ncbi:hypothetical protein H5407_09280 [Mitsuaria sp. WAJ17]|uniref:hypothetical protein n=1 Tax=Mitsuaria sp. WAJ17 TaxID=2761452 RepID=UPI00160045F6|nr:hypothetical protein [Mitsuaria sp. WAJ17]MBB2485418.1 hypothetical protein [Mitsuaria sp. WAJ17]